MPAARETVEDAVELVTVYCERRSTDDYRIEHSVRGSSITIAERRPPWNPAFGPEWSSMRIAQLRYDDGARRWRLLAAGSDDRWHLFEPAAPAAGVATLLEAIEQDRTGIFWG
jgi:Protein of unknown function (DUF3024)